MLARRDLRGLLLLRYGVDGSVLVRRGFCRLARTFALGCLIRLAGRGRGRGRAAPSAAPDDVPNDQHHQRGEHVVRVQRDVVVDGGDVVAGEVADGDPGPHPQRRADGVENKEAQPVHAGDAGDDPVRLAQTLDEARERNDDSAAAVEEVLGLVQPLLGQEHIFTEPQGQRATAEVPDGEADVVAGHRGDEGHDAEGDDVDPARAREDRPGDQDRLAGHRDTEVLQRDQQADRPEAVMLQGS